MRVKDKERVRAIGKLIGIYREERRHSTLNGYTLSRFCDGICTLNTLKRIESGECSRSEEVYDALLAKLNLRFASFPEVDAAVELLMEPLYEAIEYYRIDEIIELCDKAMRLLERVKEYVYYSELYGLFEDAKYYYEQDVEISMSKVVRYRSTFLILEEIYSSLIKRIILTKAQVFVVTDFQFYKTLTEHLDIVCSKYKSLELHLVHYYYITSQYLSMKKLIDELKVYFTEKNNFCRLMDLYGYEILLYSEIEVNERKSVINNIEELIKRKQIPDIKIAESYSVIASVLHNDGQYKDSLDYYQSMQKHTDNVYLPYVVYIADCQRHLDIPFDIPKISDDVLRKYSHPLQLMYNYYNEYGSMENFVRENFILKEIAPNLNDEKLIEIFRFELYKLAEDTTSYKNLHVFDKLIEFNRNNEEEIDV